MSNCLFCKIASKEISADFILETAELFAIKDIAPQAPVHLLIIPKKHLASLLDLSAADQSLIAHIHSAAIELAKQFGLAENGFRLVNNCLGDGGQAVPHLHFHLLGGRKMTWPPG
ncbi:MAG: histidine triad nucleotide-binding protein [Candidatus Margulisiibacteriota bacterium]|jgi:histidine triad (HIT) family protein